VGEEPLVDIAQPNEDLIGGCMVRILVVEERVESGGVDEDGYEP